MGCSYSYSGACRIRGRYEASVPFSPLDMALVYEFFLLSDYACHGIHILDQPVFPVQLLAPPGEW